MELRSTSSESKVFQPSLDTVLTEYYGSLVFTRVDQKNGYCIYVAKLETMLADGSGKYIFLFVPFERSQQQRATIGNLSWMNLQTRSVKTYTLENGRSLRLPPQEFRPPRLRYDPAFIVLERNSRSTKYSSEVCNLGGDCFDMELLLDPRRKTKFQYHNRLSLTTALETFNCLINRVHIGTNNHQSWVPPLETPISQWVPPMTPTTENPNTQFL